MKRKKLLAATGTLAEALQGMGRRASRTIAFNANHFHEDDRLGQADSETGQACFTLMKI